MRRISVFVLRWGARCATLLVIGAFLYLLAGEMLNPHSGPPSGFREWAGIVLLACSLAGMLLAWKWELPGAVLSLVTLAAFSIVVGMNRYEIVGIVALPGLLFFGDWIIRKHQHPELSR
jgi:hypothetical protein